MHGEQLGIHIHLSRAGKLRHKEFRQSLFVVQKFDAMLTVNNTSRLEKLHKHRHFVSKSILPFFNMGMVRLHPSNFQTMHTIPKLHFSTPNRACPVYQTPPLFPNLDANYVTRSTTNTICLPQENCDRQITLVVDNHRLVFYLCVRPSPFSMDM